MSLKKQKKQKKKELQNANDDLKRINGRCKEFENAVNASEMKNKTLEEKTNDLEFRSLRKISFFTEYQKVRMKTANT